VAEIETEECRKGTKSQRDPLKLYLNSFISLQSSPEKFTSYQCLASCLRVFVAKIETEECREDAKSQRDPLKLHLNSIISQQSTPKSSPHINA
jgi:hypothetical protein